MVRLRVALGVASSLVAMAALSIVLTGTGEAQGNGKVQGVEVVNTPLPVTGSVTAIVSGNVNATVSGLVTVDNPSNNPVLIRDVDGQGAKQLWQEYRFVSIPDGSNNGLLAFDPVPVGKALVVEHINVLFWNTDPSNTHEPYLITMFNLNAFGSAPGIEPRFLVPQPRSAFFIVDAPMKYYVGPGSALRVEVQRGFDVAGLNISHTTATGYLVNYP